MSDGLRTRISIFVDVFGASFVNLSLLKGRLNVEMTIRQERDLENTH